MTQYLLAVHGTDESPFETEEQMQQAFAQVDAFNTELQESGAWVFAGGLQPSSTAAVVRDESGDVLHSDGPYLETKEHLGGFWVIDVDTREVALDWAAKGSAACMGAVEVRPFQGEPED